MKVQRAWLKARSAQFEITHRGSSRRNPPASRSSGSSLYLGRLRAGRQRPRRRTAEQRNELAASKFTEFHSIPYREGALQDVELAKITQRACEPTRKLSCIVVAF